MAGESQANICICRHRERRRSNLSPIGAIGRAVSGKYISTPHQFDPAGCAKSGRVVVAGTAAGGRTILPSYSVTRSHRDKGVDRIGVEALTNHYPGLGPRISILAGDNACNHRATSAGRQISITECVARIPNIRTGTGHGKYAIFIHGAARNTHRSHVLRLPRIRQQHNLR